MTLTDRDRRIVLFLIPIVLLVAFWFLILAPKRDDLSKAKDAQEQAEQARDTSVAQAQQLTRAKQTFATDYAAVVRLGKAIPATIDSPSLLVQLDRASRGTHIDFSSVTFGERQAATLPAPTTTTSTTGPAQPNGNAAAGGAPAQTAPGQTAEAAGNAVNQGNQATQNAAGTTTTTTTATTATTTTTAAPSTTTPAALDSAAVTFTFTGSYFDLADFFHRLKRFVRVDENRTLIRGRLLTIDTLSFAPPTASSGAAGLGAEGQVTATVGGTVYLAPKAEGTTGGATAAGPAGTTTGTTTAPAGSQTSSVPLATVGAR